MTTPNDTPKQHTEEMTAPRIPMGLFFGVWLLLGAQSFGGGGATLALIRRELVERRDWITDADFVRDWSICQLTPGINLLGLTIIFGKRLAGIRGIVLALFGLLLPSVTITIVLTACYVHFRDKPSVQSALHGLIPAVVGIGLLTAWKMAYPMLHMSWRQGRPTLVLAIALLLVGATAFAAWHPPVVALICAAGTLSALFHWSRERSAH